MRNYFLRICEGEKGRKSERVAFIFVQWTRFAQQIFFFSTRIRFPCIASKRIQRQGGSFTSMYLVRREYGWNFYLYISWQCAQCAPSSGTAQRILCTAEAASESHSHSDNILSMIPTRNGNETSFIVSRVAHAHRVARIHEKSWTQKSNGERRRVEAKRERHKSGKNQNLDPWRIQISQMMVFFCLQFLSFRFWLRNFRFLLKFDLPFSFCFFFSFLFVWELFPFAQFFSSHCIFHSHAHSEPNNFEKRTNEKWWTKW